MDTLYITQENCSLIREGGHLRLCKRGRTLCAIPLEGVKALVILGSANLTYPALDLLLCSGIDVSYLSKSGKIKGRFLSAKGGGAVVRLAQHAAFLDYGRRLSIAKSIIAAKIDNQMSLVRKYKYNDGGHKHDEHLAHIKRFSGLLANAPDIDAVMGVEGVSARYYWSCFGELLKDSVFTRREYRPAPDYVNGLLNLAYAFLANEVTTCLVAERFDAEIGFLHSIHYGRNSLALDVMEEFRAPFADAWVLTLLNKKILNADHFETVSGDYRLSGEGFEKFCLHYHKRLPEWRGKFRLQAKELKTALIQGRAYEPYRE